MRKKESVSQREGSQDAYWKKFSLEILVKPKVMDFGIGCQARQRAAPVESRSTY